MACLCPWATGTTYTVPVSCQVRRPGWCAFSGIVDSVTGAIVTRAIVTGIFVTSMVVNGAQGAEQRVWGSASWEHWGAGRRSVHRSTLRQESIRFTMMIRLITSFSPC